MPRKQTDNFVKNRKHPVSLEKGTGGINDCWKPSNEASISDLREYHKEKMGIKKAHRRAR